MWFAHGAEGNMAVNSPESEGAARGQGLFTAIISKAM